MSTAKDMADSLTALDHGGTISLGETLPPGDIHAVSVSLPTWDSTVGWASRDAAVVAKMKSGFFVHPLITNLAAKINAVHGPQDTQALLLSSSRCVQACAAWINRKGEQGEAGFYSLCVAGCDAGDWSSVHVVWFMPRHSALAKAYWQHTGEGISTRRVVYCEQYLEQLQLTSAVEGPLLENSVACVNSISAIKVDEQKKVIASGLLDLVRTDEFDVGEDNIWLHLSGMKAMTDVTRAIIRLQAANDDERIRVVVYGFLYLDTFKVLSRIEDVDAELLGHGSSSELDQLEAQLDVGRPIAALFCEFPTNPLLTCVDMARVRRLADHYGFVVVCDDTVATSASVDVMQYSDVVVSSLTKMYSGGCNVMGGSVMLNPRCRVHAQLKTQLEAVYEDLYFPPDVATMAHNCRDFEQRIAVASENALAVARLLQASPDVVARVYYPGVDSSRETYDHLRRPGAGYGYLLSVLFVDADTAATFFNVLDVAKGPSLGTTFTLACPYTYFAHYNEQTLAARWGVALALVRVSVGVEADVCARVEAALARAREGLFQN